MALGTKKGASGDGTLGVFSGMKDKSTKSDHTGVKQFGSYKGVDGAATRGTTAPTPSTLGPRKA